jgi:type IV pilus assembly protein PilM
VLKRNRKNNLSVVGLDLDPSHIAAAEVSVNGHIAIKRGAVAELRPGILRDGEVTDAPALTEALKTFFAENDLPKNVRLGVANQRIVVRSLDLPPLEDPKQLDAAVRAEAPDHIPMPMDEAILDYVPLGLVQSVGGPRMRVVIVAARRELIDRLVSAAKGAGLKVEGIDLAAFGMVRALASKEEESGAVLYINVAGLTNVAVANSTGCLFTRAAAGGLSAIVATLAERRSLTLEHARMWLGHVGLEAPLASVEGRHAVHARRGRAPAGRHRPQLAQLLPDAGQRRDRLARAPDRARRDDPRLRRQARRAAQPAGRDRGRRDRRGAARRSRARAPDGGRGPGGRGPLAAPATAPGQGADNMTVAMTLAYAAALAGAFGLIIGSFLNVVAYRLPRHESVVFPGSHCPSCDTPIKAYDNVPVLSWLWLRGRCRSCHTSISARYPIVEAVTAALLVAVVLDKGADSDAWLGIAFVILLVPVTLIDLDHRIIPNTLMLIGTVVSVVLILLTDPGAMTEHLIAAAAAGGFLFIALLAYPGGMGMGDVKLAFVMGLFLGRNVAPALMAGFLAGSIVGGAIMAKKGVKAGRKTKVPFGPFLAFGGLVGLFFGDAIVEWYLDTFV